MAINYLAFFRQLKNRISIQFLKMKNNYVNIINILIVNY